MVPNGHAISLRATIAWVRRDRRARHAAWARVRHGEDLLDVAPEVLRHRLWISPPEIPRPPKAIGGRVAGSSTHSASGALFVPSLVAWIVCLYNFHRDELTRRPRLSGQCGRCSRSSSLRWMSLMVARRKVPGLDIGRGSTSSLPRAPALARGSRRRHRRGEARLGERGRRPRHGHLPHLRSTRFLALTRDQPRREGRDALFHAASVTEATTERVFTDVRIPAGYRLRSGSDRPGKAGDVTPRPPTRRNLRWRSSSRARSAHGAASSRPSRSTCGSRTRSASRQSSTVQVGPAKVVVLPKHQPIDWARHAAAPAGHRSTRRQPASRITPRRDGYAQ